MADLITLASDWCEAALHYLEPPFDPPSPQLEVQTDPDDDSTAPSLTPSAHVLLTRLDLIAEGKKLRHQLDELVPDDDIETARAALVRRVTELTLEASEPLATLEPDTPLYCEISARVKKWLVAARLAFQSDTTIILDPLQLAMTLEGLRIDLEWLGVIIARLDREPFHPVTTWLDIELERIQSILGTTDTSIDPALETSIRTRLARTQSLILGRRVRSELAALPAEANAPSFWTHRLALSRLQAQVESFAPDPDDTTSTPLAGTDPTTIWIETLRDRREQLAATADELLAPLPSEELAQDCTRIAHGAIDEASESLAFLEQAPPRRGIERLELAHQDLTRVCKLLRDQARIALEPRPEPEPSAPKTPEPPASAKPTTADVEAEVTGAETEDLGLDPQPPDDVIPTEPEPTVIPNPGPALARDLLKQARDLEKTAARLRGEWQEKLTELRLSNLLGPRAARFLENLVLTLIFVLLALILAEFLLSRTHELSIFQHEFFAAADLVVCAVFLLEFAIKLSIAPDRLAYLRRHWIIDLVAALPFGFMYHVIELTQLDNQLGNPPADAFLNVLLSLGRTAQLFRFARVAIPILRITRVALILLRLSDRLVRRLASLLNRNIVLFEPSENLKPESSDRHRLISLRTEVDHARIDVEGRLDAAQRQRLVVRLLDDLERRLDPLPNSSAAGNAPVVDDREIPVEAVVERLIQMTPDQLLDRMGPAFVTSIDRYLRLLDLPLIRRFPIIRHLVAYREKSPAEAVALAANYLGHLIQRGLDIAYFLADLQGTLSPPVFLDRLGSTIVNATATPAKRLLSLGSIFLLLFVLVNTVPVFWPFRLVVDKIQTLLGWPVIILGVFCLGFWILGAWFRRIANQSADFSERIVEAQFAAHTKLLKTHRRDHDSRILSERVIDPELKLRTADDHLAQPPAVKSAPSTAPNHLFENRELVFLRNIRLLYQDYLDGSPLHRSDTKASVQLMGNLALTNLRRSHLGPLIRESRTLDRLDLNRAGSLFGGPYLWFNYITRMLVQETAILILDFNRNAVPLDRLACGSDRLRQKFRSWLAARLRIDPDEVSLPDPLVPTTTVSESTNQEPTHISGPAASSSKYPSESDSASDSAHFRSLTLSQTNPRRAFRPGFRLPSAPTRRLAETFLETVEFTAVDFLADDPARDAEILSRFGPQVAELVRRDRQQNVRRAFRSFPLHELPASMRTINPFYLYENYLAGGRIAFLPFNIARGLARLLTFGISAISRVVREILNPKVDRQHDIPSDTYWAALRKIHRMRKPVFMGSLWLRASFDVEYLGLPLPSAPANLTATPLMDKDLDFIGATRQDRIISEQIRRLHTRRLESISRWLTHLDWTFDKLPTYLAHEIPYLASRGGEALRALVTACVLDHADIATLARSIDALSLIMEHAANPDHDPASLPIGLPPPVASLRALWHPIKHHHRPGPELFDLPCFPDYDQPAQARILAYLKRHRRVVRGWVTVVLAQGAGNPWSVVRDRMREVLLRTDLWSDQILVLRAVQTLTMLDLQHNSELVWSLGGYTKPEAEPDNSPQPIPQATTSESPMSTETLASIQ